MMIRKEIALTIMTSILLNSIYAETLIGFVKYDGKPMPKTSKTQIKMDADPVCGFSHKEPVYRQGLIVNGNNTLKNVLVYLKDVKYDSGAPETQAIIDQNGCNYSPRIQGMMAGQELLIKNSDATLHNIHSMPKVNKEFNFAMPKVVKQKTATFAKSEDPFYIKCDVHPWMKTWVLVSDHPYFAVTDAKGNFSIDSIPAGNYEVVCWQEKLKKKPLTASVKIGGGTTTQDFTFTRSKKK